MIRIRATLDRDLKAAESWFHTEMLTYANRKIGKLNPTLSAFIKPRLSKIISGPPSELEIIAREYDSLHLTPALKKEVQKFFNYTSKMQSNGFAYRLAEKLKVNVCPYCNRQFTFTVINSGLNLNRPSFDHFIPKNQYPILALSFYNLIPSCTICNSTLKGDTVTLPSEFINPYLDDFEVDAIFRFKATSSSALIGKDPSSLSIYIQNMALGVRGNKIDRNIRLFRLNEVYQSHADWVSEMIRKHHYTSGKYLAANQVLFGGSVSVQEMYLMVFSTFMEAKDYDKRPLSKLTKDVFDQLKFTIP
jgi:hypothetical protein